MVALRARLSELESEQREVVKIIAGNGSGYGVGEARTPEFSRLAAELEDCINQLNAIGVEIKDAESGLVDFPAVRDGEDDVEFWHGVEEGFAGRKRIDWG
jgi:hypothetical protein